MEKEILLDQLDNRVRKGMAVMIDLYSKLISEEITEEEFEGLVDTTEALRVIFKAMYSIQAGEIEPYRDLVYRLAQT